MTRFQNLKRVLKHALVPRWLAVRPFTPVLLADIERAVRDSELRHDGELRFTVEGGLDIRPLWHGQTPRQRGEELFASLRVWDTEHNSGVLIYLQMVDRRIEIIADRGIARKVAQATWDEICRKMESAFAAGRFRESSLEAIAAVTVLLATHFPPSGKNPDELPDKPVVL